MNEENEMILDSTDDINYNGHLIDESNDEFIGLWLAEKGVFNVNSDY